MSLWITIAAHHGPPPVAMLTKIRLLPIASALIAAVLALLAIRLLAFTREYSVNMMFWDQWDFYAPLFSRQGLLASFRQQHGPHRQGLGGVYLSSGTAINNWDVSCQASNPDGYFACTLPPGWSGKIIPSSAGLTFTPAEFTVSNLTKNIDDQNFAASKK